MKHIDRSSMLAVVVALLWSTQAASEDAQQLLPQATNLQQAVQKAISSNPEVQAAWHLFEASADEERVAEGRYLPKIDLNAGAGTQSNQQKGAGSTSYDRNSMGISLTQMIFDGFATKSEVSRLNYTRLARYYDFMHTSSNIALEATSFYEQVLKYRDLVRLASENFVQHKKLYDAVVQKVQAGVARGVDLEQATGRLALAESNLLTEATNLHDMSAKYQNIVGELPSEDLDSEALPVEGLPANIQDALRAAYQGNPEFNAVIEQVLAATAELEGRNAPFLPKLELRASHDVGDNVGGIQGREYDQVVELVASYNLFNGGSDSAAKDQFRERLSFARQNRDKICTNIRQELSVAYNDIQQLTEKLRYLNQHQLSISKAREAYRAQFDIGQRTLLDLLDTENEYFQAKRNYVIAQYDLIIAQARSLHQTGQLLTALKVQREQLPSLQELRQDRDLMQNNEFACPAEAVQPVTIDKQALLASYAPAVTQPPVASTSTTDIKLVCRDVNQQVNQWVDAWSRRDVTGYLQNYAPNFTIPNMTHQAWVDLRTQRIQQAKGIQVSVENLHSQQVGNRMEATFTQLYRNQTYTDRVEKALVFDNVGGKCRIVEEFVRQGRLY